MRLFEFLLVVLALVLLSIGFFESGKESSLKAFRTEAIKAGAGEYVTDPKTAKVSFRFMACDHRQPYGPPSPQRPGAIGSAE